MKKKSPIAAYNFSLIFVFFRSEYNLSLQNPKKRYLNINLSENLPLSSNS